MRYGWPAWRIPTGSLVRRGGHRIVVTSGASMSFIVNGATVAAMCGWHLWSWSCCLFPKCLRPKSTHRTPHSVKSPSTANSHLQQPTDPSFHGTTRKEPVVPDALPRPENHSSPYSTEVRVRLEFPTENLIRAGNATTPHRHLFIATMGLTQQRTVVRSVHETDGCWQSMPKPGSTRSTWSASKSACSDARAPVIFVHEPAWWCIDELLLSLSLSFDRYHAIAPLHFDYSVPIRKRADVVRNPSHPPRPRDE
jgi:hypothetical protein